MTSYAIIRYSATHTSSTTIGQASTRRAALSAAKRLAGKGARFWTDGAPGTWMQRLVYSGPGGDYGVVASA